MDRSKLYDRLYAAADRVLKKHNPCGSCPIGCASERNTRSWCCGGCKYLGPDGCTVQALACKLWLCGKTANNNMKATRQLLRLVRVAARYRLLYYRSSKEDTLNPSEDVRVYLSDTFFMG